MKIKRQKHFTYYPPPFVQRDIPTTQEGDIRYYHVGNEKYPSITSVLGYFKKDSLQEWRNRVGEDEANKVSARASRRGTIIHEMVEKYLDNQDLEHILEKRTIPDLMTFRSLVPELNNIGDIMFQEQPLYSKTLKIAGRCDLAASYKGELAIIDFKTSLHEKRKEWITDYFEQTTAYSLMLEDMCGIDINKIVVIIANDESPFPQVFVEDKRNYAASLICKLDEFNRKVK